MNIYQKLPWDSDFFGYGVVRITASTLDSDSLAELLKELSQESIKLAYWFVDPNNKNVEIAAQKNKGLLVDEKVTFIRAIPEYVSYDKIHIISTANKPVTEQLLRLAYQAGQYSRYKIDPHFIEDDYKRMYQIWIERSVKKEIAEDVFVYLIDGVEAGFITIGKKNNRGDIGLLAVDEQFRGKSIGKQLVQAAFLKARELGNEDIQVVTQKKNVGACKFYEKNGFAKESIENIYHFWL